MSSRVAQVVIAVGVVACAPLAWFVASAGAEPQAGADYAWQPPDIGSAARWMIGLLAAVAVVAGYVVARAGVRRGSLSPTVWQVATPLAALAAYVGCFYAVATAPVMDANIGAGLLFLGLFVAVPGAVLLASRPWWRRRRASA